MSQQPENQPPSHPSTDSDLFQGISPPVVQLGELTLGVPVDVREGARNLLAIHRMSTNNSDMRSVSTTATSETNEHNSDATDIEAIERDEEERRKRELLETCQETPHQDRERDNTTSRNPENPDKEIVRNNKAKPVQPTGNPRPPKRSSRDLTQDTADNERPDKGDSRACNDQTSQTAQQRPPRKKMARESACSRPTEHPNNGQAPSLTGRASSDCARREKILESEAQRVDVEESTPSDLQSRKAEELAEESSRASRVERQVPKNIQSDLGKKWEPNFSEDGRRLTKPPKR